MLGFVTKASEQPSARHLEIRADTFKSLHTEKKKEKKGAILVRFFSTVGELMSGELVPSAKAFVTAVTGERFLGKNIAVKINCYRTNFKHLIS